MGLLLRGSCAWLLNSWSVAQSGFQTEVVVGQYSVVSIKYIFALGYTPTTTTYNTCTVLRTQHPSSGGDVGER